ncbi:MAG: MFS transporter [Desulfobacteraceae bacterium]|nr:MFS transporter [Desulfobacteraceae bacterium]
MRSHHPSNATAPVRESSFQTGNVLVLSVCHFVHDVYSGFLSPLLPLLIQKLSLSLTQAGLLSTFMQIPHLFNPWIGMLADRVSVRYFIIFAPAATAVPMSLLGVAPGYGMLLLLMAVTGVSVALFHVPAPVMIARVSGRRTGRGMSFFMSGGELARTVSPLVAVAAVGWLGLEGFYPVMLFGIAASAWLFVTFRDVPVHDARRKKIPLVNTLRSMGPVLTPLAAILVLRGFMHGALATFLPTFVKIETGQIWLAGIALTIFEGAGVVGVLAAGSLSDVFGRRKVLALSLLGAPVALFLFTATTGWIRYPFLVLIGFTLLSTTPVMLALVQEHAGRSPAAANGLYMMVSFLARSATVVVVGWIGDRIGLSNTYSVCAVLGILAVPLLWFLPDENRK